MPKVVFDIETRGFEGSELDPIIKESLIKNVVSEEEQADVLARTGLLPISGEVVAIAMLNPDTGKGKIYFQAPESENKNYEQSGVEFIVATEKEILEKFWLDIKFYDQIITYNGRGFDVPFIIFRSIALGIKPTKNLMPYRYSSKDHFDILDQLTFYGAFRKFSLEVLCRAFNIKNPKEEGVSGLAINELFKNKDYQTIAEYCMRDVVATKELYEKVKAFIEI
ncbi:MAG TPA: ribonuclease H-like domain-containing protein [bacterium]|nr:ribonuclease H-like domain-containing protein [bacterium]